MRIKRVVVQGFKTFAQKTEFIFDPGITAIVGPNGSGKSNVVDAVRWCLGEQSFSLLRSKKTSDIIFSGSDKRARLGMAQVSITLDNSEGDLPIDFAEVEIARRAYRDGDNEYLLNGKRVRLLDITELLSHTGLGKRTYAVVGQGLIDKVLSLSPEERRSLFEEAAGITNYQAKRTTTLRQLDATQQNLTRVEDIIAELSPRLRYLKRQADRAREREQIANDLRGMLRQWYGYRWHTALGELEQNRLSEQELRESTAVRQQMLNELGKQIETLRQCQANLRLQQSQLHSESSALHSQAEQISRELAVQQERLRQIQSRREETVRELSPLHLQAETIAKRLSELDATIDDAVQEYQERQAEVEALQVVLAQQQQVRQTLQDRLESARRHLQQIRNQQTDKQSRSEQLQERSINLQDEQEAQRQARVHAEREAQPITEELEQLEIQVNQKRNQAEQLQATIATLQQQVDALQVQFKQADDLRQEADRRLDQLQTRFDLLNRLRNEGAGYASGVRAVLQTWERQSHSHNISEREIVGILGTVATLIRVPSHLDKAIETALGGAFQNIVTERWEDARRAIEFLKQTGRGRATFLPLDRLNVLPEIPAPTTPGLLGNAATLVAYDKQIEEVARSLLGRVWVAEELSAARTSLDRISRGPRPTVVTVGGEIVRPGGAVTGGRDSNRRDESVFAREREYRKLPTQIKQARQYAVEAAEACSTLRRQIEQIQIQIEANQQELADLAQAESHEFKQLEELRRRLDRAQQTVQWQTERLTQTESELDSLSTRRQATTTELEILQTEESKAVEELAAAEAQVEQTGTSELLNQLADLRTAAAEAQGNLRSQQTLRESQRRNHQSSLAQIASKEQRIIEFNKEIETLNHQVQGLGQQENQLSLEIAKYREQIEPIEKQLAEVEKAQTDEEQKERTSQQKLRQDERAWNAAQLRLQRSEDLIEQLRNDIEHDFGLVMLEQSDDLAYQPPLPLEAVVEQLPVITEVPEGLETEVKEMRARLSRVSNVNPDAPREYDEAAGRHGFLLTQSDDLKAATSDLRKVITELDELMEVELDRTFKAVTEQFVHFFKLLFNGGTARLVLTQPDDLNNTGIEIIARPPGKRPQSLALLSGGERALSACALIFSILRVSPTPFCVLDEVDAALDESNVDRFRQTVESLTDSTQFIIVTHNRRTLEGANAIYGVTMGDDGVSRTISLRLEGDTIVRSDGETNGTSVTAVEELVKM